MTFEAYRRIFQNRDYRLFWIGFTFSFLGDSLTRVAFTWFVYELTQSAEALGVLMISYTGPIIIGGFLAGWLLDRFGRRRVMLVDSVIRGCAIALVPLLYWLGRLEVWHVYVAAGVYGLLWMIALAGGPSLIPSLVKPDQLSIANALEMLSFNIGGVIGPMLAGWLIAWLGAPNVVVIDVISYFAFALLLAQMHTTDAQHTQQAAKQGYGLGDAVRLLLRNPVLFATTFMFMAFNIGGGMSAVWLPILVDRQLDGGAALYGLLLGAQAAGEVVSALLAGGVNLPLSLGARICVAQFLSGASLLFLIASQNVWLVALGLVLFGIFSTPLTIWAQTLRMQIIPAALRGRTFALLRTLMQSGNPIGGALGGWLLPLLGIPTVIGLSALIAGVPGVVGYGVKALREAGTKEEEVAVAH